MSGHPELTDTMEECMISLEVLNNDCLLHIFSYLKLRDLVALEQMSERFLGLVQYTYRRGFTVIDVFKEGCHTNEFAKAICERVGSNVTTLIVFQRRGKAITEAVLKTFLRNCPNIINLTTSGYFQAFGNITMHVQTLEINVDHEHDELIVQEVLLATVKIKSLLKYETSNTKFFDDE
ncbi:hypothetical protein DMENIID0001_015440 [Sergentomyia squamirostris]